MWGGIYMTDKEVMSNKFNMDIKGIVWDDEELNREWQNIVVRSDSNKENETELPQNEIISKEA
jgi:hypothetical protein